MADEKRERDEQILKIQEARKQEKKAQEKA
jgi:hypothetical protein